MQATERSSLTGFEYNSPFSSRGHFADVEQHATENTPLLAGPSCNPFQPNTQGYTGPSHLPERRLGGDEPSSEKRKAMESPEHLESCRRSERNERGYSCPSRLRSSSESDHRPVKATLARSPSSSTVLNETEICQGLLAPNAVSSPQHSPLLFLSQGISLSLENSGSVARDHLASERTFLAYMRTSLAIASSGVALVQLFSAASASSPQGSTHRLHVYIRPLGATTVMVGLLVLIIGVTRYFTVQVALTKGYFPVARMATGLIAVFLTALVALTFAIMMAGKLEAKEPRKYHIPTL
ncbi:hypothetical protein GALMADRAFT_238081 [Galerina marginata CBS 339.88]|uniref:DUF202 domain-containing protein n=1 Tax=Galerina marginata (strain CBS 339.88) TaxID=685588 RepID=A0A067TRU6_GALM3|nr:hypothetical protein GALMADRAFT_238081 [Galerina marginata CBS 339.88]